MIVRILNKIFGDNKDILTDSIANNKQYLYISDESLEILKASCMIRTYSYIYYIFNYIDVKKINREVYKGIIYHIYYLADISRNEIYTFIKQNNIENIYIFYEKQEKLDVGYIYIEEFLKRIKLKYIVMKKNKNILKKNSMIFDVQYTKERMKKIEKILVNKDVIFLYITKGDENEKSL